MELAAGCIRIARKKASLRLEKKGGGAPHVAREKSRWKPPASNLWSSEEPRLALSSHERNQTLSLERGIPLLLFKPNITSRKEGTRY